jgi:hypothetical protein
VLEVLQAVRDAMPGAEQRQPGQVFALVAGVLRAQAATVVNGDDL